MADRRRVVNSLVSHECALFKPSGSEGTKALPSRMKMAKAGR